MIFFQYLFFLCLLTINCISGMQEEENPYIVLGIPPTATTKEINTAYKKLALRWHPDRNPNNPVAEENFKNIAIAHGILNDPKKRLAYARSLQQEEEHYREEAEKKEYKQKKERKIEKKREKIEKMKQERHEKEMRELREQRKKLEKYEKQRKTAPKKKEKQKKEAYTKKFEREMAKLKEEVYGTPQEKPIQLKKEKRESFEERKRDEELRKHGEALEKMFIPTKAAPSPYTEQAKEGNLLNLLNKLRDALQHLQNMLSV